MYVTLEQASLTGAISEAELTLAIEDGRISMENIRDVGVVTQTSLTRNPWAELHLSLGAGAVWTVAETCYLSGLELSEDAVVQAEPGSLVTLTVDGEETALEPGVYEGELVLEVREDPDYVPEETVEEASEISAPAASPSEAPAETAEEPASQAPSGQETVEPESETSAGSSRAPVFIGIVAAAVVLGGLGVAVRRRKKS